MTPRQKYEAIVGQVATKHGLSPADINSTSRYEPYVVARHEVWAMLRRTTTWSYPFIAKIAKKDHTTIISGVKRHCERSGLTYSVTPVIFTSVRAGK